MAIITTAATMVFMLFLMDNLVEKQHGVFGPASGRQHWGLDISTKGDPTIYAVRGGKVKYAREVKKGAPGWGNTWEWGWFVWIVGDDGLNYIYAHCKADSLKVKEGQTVKAGQAIGIMGNTGNAAGGWLHVHFEVRKPGGTPINPAAYAGIKNQVGSWPNPKTINPGSSAGQLEDDDMKYRVYDIVYAGADKEAALAEFKPLKAAAPREYILTNAGGDGRWRIGHVVMATENLDNALANMTPDRILA